MGKKDFTEDDLFPDDYVSDETDRLIKVKQQVFDKFYEWTREEMYKTKPTFEKWMESLTKKELNQLHKIIMKNHKKSESCKR